MDVEKYRIILTRRQQELQSRLQKIEADFEAPRNPDDDDRAVERNNDEVLEELGESGQRELGNRGGAGAGRGRHLRNLRPLREPDL